VWAAAAQALNAACEVPWTLLSAGVPFDVFARQAEHACRAGASGVIAGRAVWAEAVALAGDERTHFLQTTGIERMQRLTNICRTYGAAWTLKSALPVLGNGWYQQSARQSYSDAG
jgi:tagatose 1,6-diphosphate aldolase